MDAPRAGELGEMTIETTIRDGLPVLASGRICRAEPDVGIMSQFVEDLEVCFLSGHPVPGELSDEEDRKLVQELLEAYDEPPDYDERLDDKFADNKPPWDA